MTEQKEAIKKRMTILTNEETDTRSVSVEGSSTINIALQASNQETIVIGSRDSKDVKAIKTSSPLMRISPKRTTQDPPVTKIRLGICALDKKARSKPMGEILSRLDEALFEIVYFGDNLIINEPIEMWPVVDVLIAFYSTGYPLAKAEAYAAKCKPFLLNDLSMQWTLLDRRKVYEKLEQAGIDLPRHVFVSRDGYRSKFTPEVGDDLVVEHDDSIEVNGMIFRKPFVEKPVNSDDHNIRIYYPTSAGGGCKKLFRKVGDRSSEFDPDTHEIRRDGSYIYEDYVETQGTDVKMYTVGPDYAHVECRKSPSLDGVVIRGEDGKEVRYPVILSLREKEIARRIVIVFKQMVCGFDLLRVQEGDSLTSFVCDVNGWSFVKSSRKYYDDCAQILTEHILAKVKPRSLRCFSTLTPLLAHFEHAPKHVNVDPEDLADSARKHVPKRSSVWQKKNQKKSELMSRAHRVLRSFSMPMAFLEDKQEEQDEVPPSYGNAIMESLEPDAPPIRDLSNNMCGVPASLPVMLIDGAGLESEVNQGQPSLTESSSANDTSRMETDLDEQELRCVIAIIRHGDRTPKQKLKVVTSEPLILQYFSDHSTNLKKELKVKERKPMVKFLECVTTMIASKEEVSRKLKGKDVFDKEKNEDVQTGEMSLYNLYHLRDVLERWKIVGLNRKLQIKPRAWSESLNPATGEFSLYCTEVQLILKWGGNLTKLGERQAVSLGERFRYQMYPDTPGGGILRLHSTFRHDLKIKTSDEGRVMKTAAAFAKGLLELEGDIAPILVSLVHKEQDSLHMLDPSGNKEVKKELEDCKQRINRNLQTDFEVASSSVAVREMAVGPLVLQSLHTALKKVGNPRRHLFEILALLKTLVEQFEEMLDVMQSEDEKRIEGGEGLRASKDGDDALSGIKIYKGETLFELTERWRNLYLTLYDEDTDTFDLSRIPDVHDYVRFDILHNPHLLVAPTLHKLYEKAKVMADCVVPQEYGVTIEEKRDIGTKMCRALLEKIKYDLIIARTDNQVDMRYMINMDYSADLPISTLGRRVRTRLYFTSESHLHTLINVLRFAYDEENSKNSPLSKFGKAVIANAPELCYLTQIIIRLFEDRNKDSSDPKRYRVEILFSPGAASPPRHSSDIDRDNDSSRFDTDDVEVISKESLTCQELEEYLDDSIKAGFTMDEGDNVSMTSSAPRIVKEKLAKRKELNTLPEKLKEKETPAKAISSVKNEATEETVQRPEVPAGVHEVNQQVDSTVGGLELEKDNLHEAGQGENGSLVQAADAVAATVVGINSEGLNKSAGISKSIPEIPEVEHQEMEPDALKDEKNERERIKTMAKLIAKRYMWRGIAIGSLVLGVGCLLLARRLQDDLKTRRKWRH